MARDRKRAKQRRDRSKIGQRAPRGAAGAGHTELHRADLPGALEHASGEVDEFDAALIRGAQGVPAPPSSPALPEALGGGVTEPPLTELGDEEANANGAPPESPPVAGAGGGRGGRGSGGALALEPAGDGGGAESAGRAVEPRERRRLPARAVAFLRASWAELQRVQWPDRPQVSQATAVVLGFVAIAGLYLGAADWVAQKVVNFIL